MSPGRGIARVFVHGRIALIDWVTNKLMGSEKLAAARNRVKVAELAEKFVKLTFTFREVVDLIGSDEGFREYLWSPQRGMWYAMGCLLTERFYRYIVTILFDMFFTVILFKHLYSKLVQAAGFSVKGREWIANGFVSTLISVMTFEVYANMTRFE